MATCKLLAGGQSLVPMLNFRLARPDHLVDLNDLTELDYVRVGEAPIEIGALARHHRLATDPQIRAALPLLAQAPLPSAITRSAGAARSAAAWRMPIRRRSFRCWRYCSMRTCCATPWRARARCRRPISFSRS